jgi:hypothetical protein
MTDVVEIIRDLAPQVVEVVSDPNPQVIEVVAAGPQGPAGTPGPNSIGGYGFAIEDEVNGDVLGFNGTAWYNRRQETLSDGGNF